MTPQATSTIHRKLVDSLYVEAMLLADEARAYFDVLGRAERDSLEALSRVTFSCESLKVTTRLMHIIAWLLHRRAMIAGDPGAGPNDSAARIGEPVAADWSVCLGFDSAIRRIIGASERLFERVAALEAGWDTPQAVTPVQELLAQLEARL